LYTGVLSILNSVYVGYVSLQIFLSLV
jgi:hypothetical protein